ncbi:MAG: M48 family metalloprotease [Bacteroidia bacterium]|nr:M48 family metalloprotease [Bacteroidia bacterium]MDW8157437.1 M48 family metalloprotease [Bacteroidia bacterium]
MEELRRYRLIIFLVLIILGPFLAKFFSASDINLFKIEDDLKLGQKLSVEIANNPSHYKILDPVEYKEAYNHIYRIVKTILNSGKLKHRDDFRWEVKIIHDDKVLNAFCAPGGFIYVYTGLIKFLDNESQLAGVLGHEMAHADLRHSTRQMTAKYGTDLLITILMGGEHDQLTQIATNITSLAYSREHETEADLASVAYLCGTEYDARGTAGFFEKLLQGGQAGAIPEFLSTHPNPENRIENIYKEAQKLGCKNLKSTQDRYAELKSLLP